MNVSYQHRNYLDLFTSKSSHLQDIFRGYQLTLSGLRTYRAIPHHRYFYTLYEAQFCVQTADKVVCPSMIFSLLSTMLGLIIRSDWESYIDLQLTQKDTNSFFLQKLLCKNFSLSYMYLSVSNWDYKMISFPMDNWLCRAHQSMFSTFAAGKISSTSLDQWRRVFSLRKRFFSTVRLVRFCITFVRNSMAGCCRLYNSQCKNPLL